MKLHVLVFSLLLSVFACANSIAQVPSKRILLEKITSAGCPGCPDGDIRLQNMLAADSSLIVVAIHRADYWHPDSMATPDGNDILDEYLWAHPTVMVDRIKWSDFDYVCLLSSMWQPKVDLRKMDPVRATVGGSCSYDSITRGLSVTVEARIFASLNNDYRINAYLVESPVIGNGRGYDQLNGSNNNPSHPLYGLGDTLRNYAHEWVLRDMLGDAHGQAGIISMPAQAGDVFSHTFTTQLPNKWNAENMYVVALIQKHNPDPEMREILNSEMIPLNGSVLASMDPESSALNVSIFPQPGHESIEVILPNEDRFKAQIYSLGGSLMGAFDGNGGGLSIPRNNLPAGMYLLKLEMDRGGKSFHKILFAD